MTESEKGVHTLEKFHEFEDKWCPAQYRGILASEENIQEGHFKELYHAISTEGIYYLQETYVALSFKFIQLA